MIKLNTKTNVILSIFFYALYIITWIIDYMYFNVIPTYSASLTIVSLSLYLIFLRKIPFKYYITVVLFSFFTQYLGAMFLFYEKIPIYDTIWHFLSGFLLVWLADYYYNILSNTTIKNNMLRLLFCFFAACAGASLWEILEFLADTFLSLQTQYGLEDTMIDIISGCSGAFIATCLLYSKDMD